MFPRSIITDNRSLQVCIYFVIIQEKKDYCNL